MSISWGPQDLGRAAGCRAACQRHARAPACWWATSGPVCECLQVDSPRHSLSAVLCRTGATTPGAHWGCHLPQPMQRWHQGARSERAHALKPQTPGVRGPDLEHATTSAVAACADSGALVRAALLAMWTMSGLVRSRNDVRPPHWRCCAGTLVRLQHHAGSGLVHSGTMALFSTMCGHASCQHLMYVCVAALQHSSSAACTGAVRLHLCHAAALWTCIISCTVIMQAAGRQITCMHLVCSAGDQALGNVHDAVHAACVEREQERV